MSEALRQIVAMFDVDTTKLEKGLKDSDQKVDGLTGTLKKLAGGMAAAFAAKLTFGFVNELLEVADQTVKTADALNLGVVELQEWQHAASMSGIKTEMFQMAVSKLTLGLSEAATKGAGPAAESLKALGIEAENSDGGIKKATAVIEELADKYASLEDKGAIAPHLMKLFGEQGLKLVPMLKGGAAGIREMRAEVEALGFAFDEQFAGNAEEFKDNIERLEKSTQGLMIQAIGPLLPGLVSVTEALIDGAKAVVPMFRGFIRFVRETKFLEVALGALSVKGLIMGAKALTAYIAKLGGLKAIFMRLLPFIFKVIAPLLILEDLLIFATGGKSAIGELLDKAFGPGTGEKIQAIISKVAEFLGLTDGFKNFAFQALGAIEMLGAGADIVWTEMKFAGLAAAAAISDGFMGAWNSVIGGAETALEAVATVTSLIPGLDGKSVSGAAKGVRSLKGEANSAAIVQEQYQAAREAIAEDVYKIGVRASYGRPSESQGVAVNQTNSNVVQINMPAGTTPNQARAIGAAVSNGVSQANTANLRATREALVPRPA